MKRLTYAQLGRVLRSLGLAERRLDGGARGYQHETGARLIFPNFPQQKKVLPHHLAAVRVVLAELDRCDRPIRDGDFDAAAAGGGTPAAGRELPKRVFAGQQCQLELPGRIGAIAGFAAIETAVVVGVGEDDSSLQTFVGRVLHAVAVVVVEDDAGDFDFLNLNAKDMLDQLAWWTNALKGAREKTERTLRAA